MKNDIAKKEHAGFQNMTLFFMRLVVAAIFLFAAWAKLSFWSVVPEGMSDGMVNLTRFLSVVEPLGALALIVGFLTRWAAAGLGIIMIGAILILRFTMNAAFFTMPQALGIDYNTLILAGCMTLAAFGAGKWSVDAIWKK